MLGINRQIIKNQGPSKVRQDPLEYQEMLLLPNLGQDSGTAVVPEELLTKDIKGTSHFK